MTHATSSAAEPAFQPPPTLTGPNWHDLTTTSGKPQVFATDLVAREGWASVTAAEDGFGPYALARSTALMWVRPDAFAAGRVPTLLDATVAAGFRPLAARPASLDRAGVRLLWAYMCRWATAERLWLLDALAALGPGLLVLWADDTPRGRGPAERLTRLKGANTSHRRRGTGLRELACSPNRLLTMVHTADDAADVVRELPVLLPWQERHVLLAEAVTRHRSGTAALLDDPVQHVQQLVPAFGTPAPASAQLVPRSPEILAEGNVEQRWTTLWHASQQWPLLAKQPGPEAWPEQATRSPWR